MISSLNPSTQQFLNDLNQIGDSMQQAQNQVTTGLKVSQVSDQPDVISTLLATRASLSTSQQISTNLGSIKTETDSGEQALQSAVTLFDQVQTLGASGVTSTSTAATNATLTAPASKQRFAGNGRVGGYQRSRAVHLFGRCGPASALHRRSDTDPACERLSCRGFLPAPRVAQHPDGSTFAISLLPRRNDFRFERSHHQRFQRHHQSCKRPLRITIPPGFRPRTRVCQKSATI